MKFRPKIRNYTDSIIDWHDDMICYLVTAVVGFWLRFKNTIAKF